MSTDLSYLNIKQNKTKNKIRRLFEGETLTITHVVAKVFESALKKEDFDKLLFWEQRNSLYCKVQFEEFTNKKEMI